MAACVGRRSKKRKTMRGSPLRKQNELGQQRLFLTLLEDAADDDEEQPISGEHPGLNDRLFSEDDEEEMLLAPKLVFTPGGTPYKEGDEPEIESPFVETVQKATVVPLSPTQQRSLDTSEPNVTFDTRPSVLKGDDSADGSESPAEAKISDPSAQRFGTAVLAETRPLPDMPRNVDSAPQEEVLPHAHSSSVADARPQRSPTFSSVTPSLVKQSQMSSSAASFPHPSDFEVISGDVPTSIGDGLAEAAADTSFAAGRLRAAGHTLALLGQYLLTRIKAACAYWKTSVLPLASRTASQASSLGGRLAANAGKMLSRLGRQGLLACRNAWFEAVDAAKTATPHISAFAKKAFALAREALAKATIVLQQALTSLQGASKGFAETAGRLWPKSCNEQDGVAIARPPSEAIPPTQQVKQGPTVGSSEHYVAVADRLIAQLKAASAVGPSVEEPVAAANASPKSKMTGLLEAFQSSQLAFSGVAAASIVLLFAVLASNQTAPSAKAAIVFPIPDRPIPPSAVPELAEPWWNDANAEIAAPSVDAASLPALNNPLDEMLAYVSIHWPAEPETETVSAVLTKIETTDGLGQFARAAEVVGLKKLLETGGPYTIFVPNDLAFEKLPPGEFDSLLEPAEHVRLLTLLSHHVVGERLTFDDIAGRAQDVTSLAGQKLAIDATEIIRVDQAGMVDTDLLADENVIHIIDSVLVYSAL